MSSGIRSRRGRAEAYRGWWQGALRSPQRALLTALVAITALVLLTHLLGSGQTSTAPRAAPPDAGTPPVVGAAPAAPGTSAATPTSLGASSTPPAAPAPRVAAVDPAATQTANNWAARWLAHGSGPDAAATWRAQLTGLTTPEYLGLLSTVDLSQVPLGAVTGPARVTPAPGGASAVATVPTSAAGLTLRLTLVRVPGQGWQVSNADQAS